MKKIVVPKSVRKQVIIWMIERFILLLVLLFVAYIIADYALRSMYEEANIGNLSFTIFFIYIFPFVISKIPQKLFDRDWYGEIIGFDTDNHEFQFFDGRDRREKITITALIKEKNGKLHRQKIGDEKLYRVGTRVIHIYGTEHLVPYDKSKPDMPKVCPICSNQNSCYVQLCKNCGVSLETELVDMQKRK